MDAPEHVLPRACRVRLVRVQPTLVCHPVIDTIHCPAAVLTFSPSTCLDLRGTRLEEAITAGCIPVIAQDGVFLPGHDVLPYEEFSVTLRYEDLDNLPAILGSFSQEDIESLQVRYSSHRHERACGRSRAVWRSLS